MRIDAGIEIASRLCLKPEFIANDFAAMLPGLQAGRFDMLDTGLFFTEERAKTIIFIPDEKQAFSVSVPLGNPDKINDLDALDGKIVSTEFGSFANNKLIQIDQQFRARGLRGMTIRTFENLTIAYQALRAGQIQAVFRR